MNAPIRTLVIGDDALARERIAALLAHEPDIELTGECTDGSEAIARIRLERPDLLFLDVQMPHIDGSGVVEAIGTDQMPVTIFVSADVAFALRAFDANALDYLLKPLDGERFAVALARAREAVRSRRPPEDPRFEADGGPVHSATRPAYPETLAIKAGDQFRFVSVTDVDYLAADGNYIHLHVQQVRRVAHSSLKEMERVLDPEKFVRIHRSTIVNISRIAFVEPLFHGDLSVALKNGTRLVCSRRFRSRLEERVHFTS